MLLEKYEVIRSSGLGGGSSISTSSCRTQSIPDSPLSARQLYLELRQELDRALGLTSPVAPVRGGSALDRVGTAGVAGAAVGSGASTAPASNVGSCLHSVPTSSGGDAVIHRQQDQPALAARQTSILVVDDSHISCKLAKRALAQLNFHAEVRVRTKGVTTETRQ